MTSLPLRTGAGPNAPTSEEFLRTLGQVTWLMGLSPAHRDLPIRAIEARVQLPLILKQVRVYTQGNRPVAAIIWAGVSESIKQALRFDSYQMQPSDWRSGPEIVVIDCISPFEDRQRFEALFQQQVHAATTQPTRAKEN